MLIESECHHPEEKITATVYSLTQYAADTEPTQKRVRIRCGLCGMEADFRALNALIAYESAVLVR